MYAELERKRCAKCLETKNLEMFRYRTNKGANRKPHYESYCKPCEKYDSKKWYAKNKAHQKARDFVRNCNRFGITAEEYRDRIKAQNRKCAICKRHESSRRNGCLKNLAIDHCHITGKIRALLCHSCNTAIGLMQEDPKRFIAASRYLRKFKK